MIYKPETVVDLDTGAVVQAQVQPGDHTDHHGMATTIFEAQQSINEASGEAADILTVKTVTADKGYYAVEELQALQHEEIKTVIADPVSNRRLDKLEPSQRQAVQAALRSTRSKYGKALLRRRGMHIERSFAHILDCGGMRRATLRGWENLNKRFKLAGAFYNLSQLMRKLFGFGTSKQLAALASAVFALLSRVWSLCRRNIEPRHSTASGKFQNTWREFWTDYPRGAGNWGFFNRLLGGKQSDFLFEQGGVSMISAPMRTRGNRLYRHSF